MDESSLITNIKIYAADSYGRGVGRHEGKVVFVPFTAPGDVIDCRVVSSEDSYDIAELTRIIEPSGHRVEPPCPYFGVCPGCTYQHIEYNLELELKGKRIAECLGKFGGTDAGEVKVTGSPNIFGYRSHVTLHLWYNGDETWCGLIDVSRRKVMHIDKCLLLPQFARDLPGRVRKLCADLIGEYRGRFALRLPFIMDHVGRRVMLAPGRSPMRNVRRMMRVVFDELESAFPVVKKIQRIIYGHSFKFNPLSFTQANEALMPKLYEKARRAVASKRKGKILDLYSGVGVLGVICAGEDGVTFIEQTPSAVEDIQRNVISNGVVDATIVEADVAAVLGDILNEDEFGWVLVNPPRKGIPKEVVETLAGCSIKDMVYVSCNPATLGRDVGRLREGGFKVVSAEGVDMFPRTPHVESVVVLSR